VRGKYANKYLTYIYRWRIGDAIQVMTVAPSSTGAGPEQTLALSRRLAAHAE
jgi:hypothetical protein